MVLPRASYSGYVTEFLGYGQQSNGEAVNAIITFKC